MTAWTIGRHLKAEPVSDVYQAEKIQYGDLRTGWRFSAHVLSSSVSLEVTLDKGAAGLQYHIEADWNELGGETIPLLVFACPLAYESPSVLCDIPMGSIVRNEVNHDIPALSYCSALPAKKTVTPMALITDTKYGYRSFQNRICCSLINTSTDPDPAPERGKHEMNLWLTLGDKTPKGMHAIASFVNRPFRWVSDNPHKGTLPMEGQLLKTGLGSCVISSVAKNSREELEITLHEISGQESQVQITLPVSFKEAKLKDLTGKEIGKAGLSDKGQKVTASIQPYKIVMICLK